jgi:hypothetical protein
LIEADPERVDDRRVELLHRTLGELRDDEVEARAPAQHAEDQRAHEARLAREKERGVEPLALDALEEMQRVGTLRVHRPLSIRGRVRSRRPACVACRDAAARGCGSLHRRRR